MSHSKALEGGFIPNMDEEEQKRFTPSELLLYRHALEYRYLLVCTKYTQDKQFMNINALVCTKVHTIAFLFIYCPYMVRHDDTIAASIALI